MWSRGSKSSFSFPLFFGGMRLKMVVAVGVLLAAAGIATAQTVESVGPGKLEKGSNAVGDSEHGHDRNSLTQTAKSPEEMRRWLSEMSVRLAREIPESKVRTELLKTVHFEALRVDLDPQLVLALIEVASGFRKYAISPAGARGYMQVMPFWVKLIGKPSHNLFHSRLNVRYGCVILRHYLDLEKGDYFRALGRYHGSLGKAEYPNLVLTVWKEKWGYAGATN